LEWSWDSASKISGFLVDVTLLLGAVAAILKFRLFNLLGHRWHSSLQCQHYELPDGTFVCTADYVVANTGQRPTHLRAVSLQLLESRREGPLLLPDDNRVIATRTIRPTEPGQRGNLQIEAGERTIFTIRCHVPTLPGCVFVVFSRSRHKAAIHDVPRLLLPTCSRARGSPQDHPRPAWEPRLWHRRRPPAVEPWWLKSACSGRAPEPSSATPSSGAEHREASADYRADFNATLGSAHARIIEVVGAAKGPAMANAIRSTRPRSAALVRKRTFPASRRIQGESGGEVLPRRQAISPSPR
jgi:hypothetical protein